MKKGDHVAIVGLLKAKQLNGKVGIIVEKDDDDRWMVEVDDEDTFKV